MRAGIEKIPIFVSNAHFDNKQEVDKIDSR